MGGASAAYRLSKGGFKVLVLERGDWTKGDEKDWDGKAVLVDKRYKGETPLLIKQYNDKKFKPVYQNEVVGGLSVFYGGAVMRMRKKDFDKWPINYSHMEPFYTEAEELLEVYGEKGTDPCEPPMSKNYPYEPPPLSEPAQRIYMAGKELGYKPFKLPLTLNFRNKERPLCIKCNTCDGFPCKIGAKNEPSIIIKKAKKYTLEIKTGIIVKRLTVKSGEVKEIECMDKKDKSKFNLSAKLIILSAGTIESSAILLRSGLEKFENHKFTGKYLMRHCNAIVGFLFPFKTNPEQVLHKQICFTDFYEGLRKELGTATGIIQDIYTPPAIALKHLAPFGFRNIAAFASGYVQNLLCIAEDEPNVKNEVTLSEKMDSYGIEMVNIEHQYTKYDYMRRDYLVKKAKDILKKAGGLIPKVIPIDTFSHAVGTLRFGENPRSAVLDKNCNFFGVKNLYVLDGSFMPNSAGVNPSLTIAANSLRVADYICKTFKSKIING